MINVQTLESNGYTKFIDNHKLGSSTIENSPYKGSWQKCIRDDYGKKYFIQVEMWDFKNSEFSDRIQSNPEPSFPSWVQFELPEEQNVKIELFHKENQSLEELEAWFEKQWEVNDAEYYELNEYA